MWKVKREASTLGLWGDGGAVLLRADGAAPRKAVMIGSNCGPGRSCHYS